MCGWYARSWELLGLMDGKRGVKEKERRGSRYRYKGGNSAVQAKSLPEAAALLCFVRVNRGRTD